MKYIVRTAPQKQIIDSQNHLEHLPRITRTPYRPDIQLLEFQNVSQNGDETNLRSSYYYKREHNAGPLCIATLPLTRK